MVLSSVADAPTRTASRLVATSDLRTNISAPLLPEAHLRAAEAGHSTLPLAAEGLLWHVCEGRFGSILIEVIGEEIFVNGRRVEQHME